MIAELLIPMAKKMPLYVIGQEEVPWALRGWVAGAFGSGAIRLDEIGHIFGGRNAKPTKPLLIFSPTGGISLIVGGGEAEAAELEELAYASEEKQERRAKSDWVAETRERMGLPPREQVQPMISEALRAHGRDKIKNPSSYPAKPKPDRGWVKNLPAIPVN